MPIFRPPPQPFLSGAVPWDARREALAVGLGTGSLATTEAGSDTAAAAGQVFEQGTFSAPEADADTAALAGKIVVIASLAAAEMGSDTAALSGSGALTTTGTLAAAEAGGDTAAIRQLPVVLMSENRRLAPAITQSVSKTSAITRYVSLTSRTDLEPT